MGIWNCHLCSPKSTPAYPHVEAIVRLLFFRDPPATCQNERGSPEEERPRRTDGHGDILQLNGRGPRLDAALRCSQFPKHGRRLTCRRRTNHNGSRPVNLWSRKSMCCSPDQHRQQPAAIYPSEPDIKSYSRPDPAVGRLYSIYCTVGFVLHLETALFVGVNLAWCLEFPPEAGMQSG